MDSSSSLPIVSEAPGFIRIYEDGTVERLVDREIVPPSSQDDNFDEEKEGVASKDVVLDPQTGVFVRFYLPRLEVTNGKGRVPVLLYFHGGGFCIGSAASPVYHHYLNQVATDAKVICLSVDYRRAPEHRLPAAYDDCFGVLEWLDRQAMVLEGVSVDPWLASHADFSKVFLAGDSAGANILHQVGIRASGRNWDGLCLQGAILVHPFFGGAERIGCELLAEAEVDAFNTMTDAIWSISLPAEADRDHPFCNPVGPRSPALSTLVYPRMLIFVAGKDLLRDRGIWYYEEIKKAGIDTDLVMTEGESHVFHLFNPKSENVPLMMKRIFDFIHSSSENPNH
uniref:Alpha/beta hydrolase fold-3 domain-containing protein n=1 Tax=Picea sitchensis TaxID=3332 RepID=A9P086_PICSI|nr:unknown [Picea sitchensis]